jgi:hypothetical protein
MKKMLLLTLTTFSSLTAWGQKDIEGKYVCTSYPTCYLIINSDKTFKFGFGQDLQWDIACGRFELKADSLFFEYLSDMFDRQCNSDGRNYTDTSGIILQDAIDKRFRPISARLSKNKIITYKIGDIADSETIDKRAYYYRRKKKG